MTTAPGSWTCPSCGRAFTRVNQRHACGTGAGTDILRGRPPSLVALYAELVLFVESLGPLEIVTRERYALFRTKRIFADATVTKDALRLALHLREARPHALFVKIVADRRQVTHVVVLRTSSELEAMKDFLRAARDFATPSDE